MFSQGWGVASGSEVLGHRWLEYVEPEDVPRVLAWFRTRDYGPMVFDAVEFGTLNPCRIALVKFTFGDVHLCFGERVLRTP